MSQLTRRSAKRVVRRDIQGLRALAVVAVFADHLFGWPSGGFVGVDIFFVISGFLITGILLREYTKTGHISFAGFYARRARRILPAALVTLAITVAISYLIFPASKALSTLWDGIAATAFVSNIRFVITGTDYFAQGAPGPLQHYWSLSVEEQFYFVWPWLMLGVLIVGTKFAKRSAEGATRVAGGIMIVAVIASFTVAMIESATNPTAAYFSTITRVWELGIGAALAIFGGVFANLPGLARIVMAWVGLCVMIGSMFVIDPASTFPAPWALLPVLGAAMTIAAGIGMEPRGNVLLTNPAAVYVGDISYSLYLWHWPVIILGLALFPDSGILYYLGASALGIVLAVLSYELIERPINASPLFQKRLSAGEQREAWRRWRDSHSDRVKRVAVTVLVPALVGMTVLAFIFPPGQLSQDDIDAMNARNEALDAQQRDEPSAYQPTDAINQGVYEATLAGSWPDDLTPSIDTVETEGLAGEDQMRCSDPRVDATSCTFGSVSGPSILVYGDSLGITLLPTVRAAYEGDHFIRGLTRPACAITDLEVDWRGDAEVERICMEHREAVRTITESMQPDVAFVIQNYAWADRLASGAIGEAAGAEWLAASRTLYEELLAAGAGQVVFVSPPPEGEQVVECATAGSPPSRCVSSIPTSWQAIFDAESTAGLPYLDETDWFCADGRCPVFNGDIIIRRDWVHPTPQYARHIAEAWRARADQVLAAPAG